MNNYSDKIRFYHCDPAGIMFFANIFFFCHSAFEEMIEEMKLSFNYFNNEDIMVPILSVSSKYYSPLKLNDVVDIELKIEEIKTHSFTIGFECKVNDKLSAKVTTSHIFLNKKTNEKLVIPEEFIIKLKNVLNY